MRRAILVVILGLAHVGCGLDLFAPTCESIGVYPSCHRIGEIYDCGGGNRVCNDLSRQYDCKDHEGVLCVL